jgi:hypothetical protein
MKHWKRGRDYKHIMGQKGNIAVLALEDPYTPVIVASIYSSAASTFDAAFGEGELSSSRGVDYQLTLAECDLLNELQDEVEEWIDEQRPEGGQ